MLASDGFLYVLNAGSGQIPNARLSQVSPVDNSEKSVISGFGTLPQYITTDGTRIFVASAAQGLMVYNTSTRLVEHDNNSAIPLFGSPRGLAVDDIGRLYALIAGPCTASGQGSVAIFGPDLVSKHPVTVGHCPVAIGVTDLPQHALPLRDNWRIPWRAAPLLTHSHRFWARCRIQRDRHASHAFATREFGVLSAIAKGARSARGADSVRLLQLLSEGQAHLLKLLDRPTCTSLVAFLTWLPPIPDSPNNLERFGVKLRTGGNRGALCPADGESSAVRSPSR